MSRFSVCLAALLAMLPGTAQTAPSARANVYLTSHRYSPAPIYLAGGVPVRIMLSNRAGQDHEFVAPDFFRKSRLLKGRVVGGQVRIRSGKTIFIDIVPARGTYKVHCGRFGHKMLGMSTMIVVT